MSTEKESPFAGLEDAFRQTIQKEAPQVFTSDPEENQTPPVAEPPPTPEETAEPSAEPGETVTPPPEENQSLEDTLSAATKNAEEEAADAKKAADAAEAAKKAAPVASDKPVHQDLEDEVKKLDPHTKPKTRQIIEGIKAKVITERERAIAAEKARADAEQRAKDLEAQVATGKPSKALEDELTTLRERVRELDATKDPEIESKYDKPISSNTEAAISLLGDLGLFTVKEKDAAGKDIIRPMTDKEKAVVVNNVKTAGVSLRTMAQHIKALEGAGLVEEAEQLRDYARENDRMAREKAAAIQGIKSNLEGRVQARTQAQMAEQEQINKIAASTSENALKTNLAEIAKSFPQINRPPEPVATDAAPVVAAKKAAIAEFDKAASQIAESVKVFQTDGLPPPKAAEARGRMAAAAVESVILKNHVLPAMAKDNTALQARVKELEAQVASFRKAGTVNRAHAAAITAGANGGAPANVPANASFADSLAAQLRARGVDINS